MVQSSARSSGGVTWLAVWGFGVVGRGLAFGGCGLGFGVCGLWVGV